MTEQILEILNNILIFDLIFIVLIILSLIKCTSKGFVFSLLSASKWLLAYILTLFLFPKTKPFVDGVIDNEYILDIALGISIFIVVIFFILLINKGISKAVKYTGLGNLDTIFGFFFGFVRSYIIAICIFSAVHVVYNHDKWPINHNKSYIFPYLKKGSNYLLKEFPDEKTYQDSKEKIKEL